ncbi:aldo/keto reductase [Leucobacter sp. HY1910]
MTFHVPTRISGPSGLEVSTLALGSWNTWDRASLTEVIETVDLAISSGATLFDIGIYGYALEHPSDGDTDIVLARAMRELSLTRDQYQIAAKGWLPETLGRPVQPLAAQLDAILQRHGTDYAEFLVLGDVMITPETYLPTLEQIKELIDTGRVRGWCVNNWSAAEISRATAEANSIGLQAPDYAQLKYGLTRRTIPEGAPMFELCKSQGLTIQASDTFEGGLIFGDTGSTRIIGGDIGGTHSRIRASVDAMRDAATSLGATVAQLAIAVPLLNQHTSNVLIGSRTPTQTAENLGAFDLLARHSRDEILAAAAPFWFDADVVSPDASWGTTLSDDPASYVVRDRVSGEVPEPPKNPEGVGSAAA